MNISVIALITLLCQLIFLSPMSVWFLRALILSYWACFLGIQSSVRGMAGRKEMTVLPHHSSVMALLFGGLG